MAICATVIANLVAGWMADRFGAGRVLVLWSVLLGVAFWTFYSSALAGAYSPALYVIAGFGVGVTALVPAIAVGGFPKTSAGVPQPNGNLFIDHFRSLYIKK